MKIQSCTQGCIQIEFGSVPLSFCLASETDCKCRAQVEEDWKPQLHSDPELKPNSGSGLSLEVYPCAFAGLRYSM